MEGSFNVSHGNVAQVEDVVMVVDHGVPVGEERSVHAVCTLTVIERAVSEARDINMPNVLIAGHEVNFDALTFMKKL